ncbi:caspase family protein [Longimicrobium sp.]|uniref:caspase family protein n=1 Tax=Longimicrobium sp. TaxID=2029185 RepID=UPI003B3A940A
MALAVPAFVHLDPALLPMNRTSRTLWRQAALFAVLLSTAAPAALLAQTERRVALVVGNGQYENAGVLRNPVNDARSVAESLRRVGFDVMLTENRSQREMAQDIREFGRRLDQNTVALYYYSGHGIQVKGENYVVPVDAAISNEEEVEYGTVNVGLVMAQMEAARSRVNIVFLDACRNNPFARSFRSSSNGLAMMNAPAGTFIAYATAPGDVASDGTAAAGNGLYTQQLLRFINTPGLPIEQMHKQVRIAVTAASNGDQVPWESSSIMGDFYFAGNNGAPGTVQTAAATPTTSSTNARPQAAAGARSDAVALAAGQRRTGQLQQGDNVMDDGSLFDIYTYEARAGERLRLTMTSGAFDAFLTVARMNGDEVELVVRDDDSGGGTNSRAEFTVDRDGPLFILANALREGMAGSYTIALEAAGGSERIALGQNRAGTLARTDPMLPDSSFYDTYSYQGRAGERVRISMTSGAFDTYLSIGQVVDGRYREVANNDDGDGTNSVLDVTLPQAGTYQIRANSFLKGQTGAYTLAVGTASGPAPQPRPSEGGGVIRPRPRNEPSQPARPNSGGGTIRPRPRP